MQLVDLLSKSEFIECSETESIADYLLKQRVITEFQFQSVVNTVLRKEKNKLLIEFLQENSKEESNEKINVYGLFVNALRYAGCHYIANILDVDEKLFVFNQDCKTRRKGQISIHIQVSALQIKAKELLSRQNSKLSDDANSISNNIIWLDKKQFVPNEKSFISGSGDKSNSLSSKKASKSKSCCFSFIFCCTFRKKKNPGNESLSLDNIEVDLINKAKSQVNSEIDKLRQFKIEILSEKSHEFYSYLNSNNSTERESLVKYFEQVHKILVFETHYDETSMVITVICMKKETLISLISLLQTGQLEKDCNNILLSKAIFEMLNVKNIKLSVSILPDDINIATQDFDLAKRK